MGKTTIASHFPGALLLAFEKGYNTLAGAMVKDVNTWGEFKKTLSELKDPDAQAVFQTVVIDTADIAYALCEKYVCNRESTATTAYESIGDIPFGKGYKLVQTEFDECIRKILQMNYGLVLISHSVDKTFKNEQGEDYPMIVPTLDNRARLVCERTCDIIGYAAKHMNPDGTESRRLFMRGTTRFVAGSRFKHTPDSIDFSYDNLVNAIANAIDQESKESNGQFVTDVSIDKSQYSEPTYDFAAMMEEFQTLVGNVMASNPSLAPKITSIVESHLGKGKKVGDCTEEQCQQLDLILFELKRIV